MLLRSRPPPASLYVYARDTEDLHAQIDCMLEGVSESVPAGTWRERLGALLTRYAHLLFEYPELARMAMFTQPSSPSYLSLIEAVPALLNEGGVPDHGAAWAVDLLLLYATANATEQGVRKPSRLAREFSALAPAITTVDVARYPNIAELCDDLVSGSGPDRF